MNYTRLLMVMALAGFLVACARQPAPPERLPDAQQAASRALPTLQQMVTEQNYREMGFESVDEVKSAVLGGPIQVYVVDLNRLKEYQAGGDPQGLLTPSNDVVYPVLVKSGVRSSIRVTNQGNGWGTSGFGGANLIKAVAKQMAGESDFEVQVPVFNLYFVGQRRENKLFLVPIVDDPRFNLKAGSALPAEEVFRLLSGAAKEHNGLPT
jgi:hypothetical protein